MIPKEIWKLILRDNIRYYDMFYDRMIIWRDICPCEHSSVRKDNALLYARVGIQNPDTLLIHLKNSILATTLLDQK